MPPTAIALRRAADHSPDGARDSELDAVSGLRLGADDFLTKDLSLTHLTARVNALFRRVDALRRPKESSQTVRRGALTLDAERMQAEWNDKVVLLSLTEIYWRSIPGT